MSQRIGKKTENIKEHNYAINKDGKISYKYGPEDVYTLKFLYSDLCIQTRKRNYDSIIIKATQLINQYPDSLQSLDAISKLYFASLRKDSAGSKVTPLKTYLETLILNNPNNTSLTTKSFYYIQKCKVSLKQYQSALAGFQQIINSNPYSYEALIASWDYAATSLLMNGGGGGSKKSEELRIQNYEFQERKENKEQLKDGENLENLDFGINNFTDNYDSTKFTKSDRVKIFDNTKKSFEDRKKKEKKAIEVLQIRSDKGDREATKELIIRRTINEVAKPVKPKSMKEHIKIINNSINKIFINPDSKENTKSKNNLIPTKYELYQNYPNPFNPITKISFDLPKDNKVKLIVYDILGREIIKLINNEFKPAGKHIIEFNGINLNLASGVYFYRIETDKFSAVKKMVLIK
jgi:tetratricopeptide (TPR) repeat protein